MKIDMRTMRKFIKDLYSGKPAQTEFSNHVFTAKRAVNWIGSENELADKMAIVQEMTRTDAWFSWSLRQQPSDLKKRGGEADLTFVPCAFIDIDILGPGHKKTENLPKNIEEALSIVKTVGIPPSWVAHSGGGIHVWYFYKDPIIVSGEKDIERARRWQRWWMDRYNSTARDLGYELDQMKSPAGLARIPGQLNLKDINNPRPVAVIESGGPRIDMNAWFPEPPEAPEPEEVGKPPAETHRGYSKTQRGITSIRELLDHLPPSTWDRRDQWLEAGMALHAEGAEYLGLWTEYSKRSEKYKDGECDKLWGTFDGIKGVTLGTLYHHADRHAPGWRRHYSVTPSEVPADPAVLFSKEVTPWEDAMPESQELKMDQLPVCIRTATEDACQVFGLPEETAAWTALGVLSTACGNRWKTAIKKGHTQFANVYVLLSMPPASGKSPLLRPFRAHLDKIQIEEDDAHQEAIRDWEADQEGVKAQIKGIHEEMRKGANKRPERMKSWKEELRALIAERTSRPLAPLVYLNNATSEAMGRRMYENNGYLGVITSEGREVLSIARGKYSAGGDIGLWLSGHGYDPLRVDRAKSACYSIREPVLAATVMTQPDSLQTMGDSDTLRDSGFLARWIYVCPKIVKKKYAKQEYSPSAYYEYGRAIRRAWVGPAKQAAFTEGAFIKWTEMHDKILTTVGGTPFRESWAAKLPEMLARISLLFMVADGKSGYIDEDTIMRVGSLVPNMVANMRRAEMMMRIDTRRNLAQETWDWIALNVGRITQTRISEDLKLIIPSVKASDLKNWRVAGTRTTSEGTAILEDLQDRGYVRQVRVKGINTGRPHELYFINEREARRK